mmetsp:Transcript_27555/g.79309  ORF Transcript_27555/g.79309 Transcript_27555/m.79309 type:complete len:89 (-) Transcript_27555:615-881(-)
MDGWTDGCDLRGKERGRASAVQAEEWMRQVSGSLDGWMAGCTRRMKKKTHKAHIQTPHAHTDGWMDGLLAATCVHKQHEKTLSLRVSV